MYHPLLILNVNFSTAMFTSYSLNIKSVRYNVLVYVTDLLVLIHTEFKVFSLEYIIHLILQNSVPLGGTPLLIGKM
ncbi:hypothetical protein RIR_jg9150.t1 [Rhizophagus irregularis DAOM 181602=DAOM 197198]|nr:hypothetical protein RIR_jg9150.t1 [Rhizophagus irregularis DAOM 181602=DAOM 197198]